MSDRHRRTRCALRTLSAGIAILAAASPGGRSEAADVCSGFRPARVDMRASSPVLARPIVALPADFNKDGTADVAVVNKFIDGTFQTGSISVFLGDLGGGLTLASNQTTPGFAQWAALNDFNKDGVPDVAAVTVSAALIFLGNGSGGFHPYTSIPVPFDPIHVSVTDMNADGNSDLVIVQQYIGQPDGRVTVLRGDGAGGFIASTPAITGQDPRAAAVADFNKDGRPDVVTGNNLASSITFLAGLGDGTFAPGVHWPVGASGGFLTAADFDKNGNLDLIMTSQNVATPALVLFGDGAGGFAVGSVLEAGDTPRNPVLCDFDKDGELDVAIPNAGSADVSVLLGDGAGAFSSAQRVATDGGASQGAIADLNADGFCDLVTANEGGNSISVMLGGVRGVLGTPTTPTGPFPLGAAAADFNADGLPDLAVVSRDDSSVHVYLGDGEGGLTLNSIEPAGVNPGAVDAGDFNADGAIDLVVANQGPPGNNQNDSIMVYYNDGDASFTLGHTLTTGNVPLDIATADFNADQRADIAVSNSQGDRVSYFLAEPFNGFGNAKTVRVGVGTRSLALGDFSGDGILDIAASHMGGSTFTVLQGTGTGFELGPDRSMPTPSPIDMMVSADVNADLVIDLIAVTQPADPFAPGELVTALGVGENNFFFPQPPQPTGTRPEALVVLDLNRTGAFDVVVANRFDNDILTFAGDGTGAFVEGQRFGTGNDPFFLVAADFNNDGRVDVASINSVGASVSMLLNNDAVADPIETLRFQSDDVFQWDPVPGAGSYRLYRELLSDLAPDSFGRCHATALNNPEFTDPALPPVGNGYFYLLTVVTGGVEGPLGFTSNCLKRPNFTPCIVP